MYKEPVQTTPFTNDTVTFFSVTRYIALICAHSSQQLLLTHLQRGFTSISVVRKSFCMLINGEVFSELYTQ